MGKKFARISVLVVILIKQGILNYTPAKLMVNIFLQK